MQILVRHYLKVEPHQDLEGLLDQYVAALWIEEHLAMVMTNSVAKAMGAK